MAAKLAAVRQQEPVESFLHPVSNPYTPKLYRLAMRTLAGQIASLFLSLI